MKKLLLLAVCVPLLAQQVTLTPNVGLQVPGYGQANWQIPVNFDLALIDKLLGGTSPLPAITVTNTSSISGWTFSSTGLTTPLTGVSVSTDGTGTGYLNINYLSLVPSASACSAGYQGTIRYVGNGTTGVQFQGCAYNGSTYATVNLGGGGSGGGGLNDPGSNGIVIRTALNTTTAVAAPSSAVVGVSDAQTLTNKSIAATEINSGFIDPSHLQNIPNSALLNSIITVNNTPWSLGGSYTVSSGGTGNVSTGGTLGSGNVITGAGSQSVSDSGVAFASILQTAAAQTITNKTINASSNTLTNIPNSALLNSGIMVNGILWSLGGSYTVSAAAAGTSGQLQKNVGGALAAALPNTDYQAPVTESATPYNTGNNGIANAAAACGLLSYQCIAQVPFSYPGTDIVSGFDLDYAASATSPYSPNTIVQENRYGLQNDYSDTCTPYSNQCYVTVNNWVYWSTQSGTSNPSLATNKMNILAGGALDEGTLPAYKDLFNVAFGKTPGEYFASSNQLSTYSEGDSLNSSNGVFSMGGVGYPGFSEGTEREDILLYEGDSRYGTVEFQAPFSSISGDKITVGSPYYGPGTLGEGRFLYRVNETPLSNTATGVAGSGCNDGGSTPCAMTLGTAVAASTAIGNVSSAVTAKGSQSVTVALTTGSASAFSPSSLVCVADYGNHPEMIYPSAVSGSGSTATLTLNFHYLHTAGYYISTGGLCGYVAWFTADNFTAWPAGAVSGVFTTGTIHHPSMVIATPTSTTVLLAIQGKGEWHNTALWTTSNNGISFVHAAVVESISTTPGQDAGQGGGQFTLGDNNTPWTSGDTVGEFLGTPKFFNYGNYNIYQTLPNPGSDAGCYIGCGTWYNMGSFASGFAFTNATEPTKYGFYGGPIYFMGYGTSIGGVFAANDQRQYSGQYGEYVVTNCFAAPVGCGNFNHLSYSLHDTAGSDGLYINMATNVTGLTAQNQADYFGFEGIDFYMPQGTPTANPGAGYYKMYVNSSGQFCTLSSSGSTNCGGGGTSGNATSIQGNAVASGTPSGTQAYVWNAGSSSFVLTTLTLTPTCAANAAAGVSGPCVSTKGAVVSGSNTRTVSGTSDNLAQTDWNGAVLYTSGSAITVAIPQPGVGSNFEAGYTTKVIAGGAGTVTLTPSGGATINGGSTLTLTGRNCVLASNGTNYTCY